MITGMTDILDIGYRPGTKTIPLYHAHRNTSFDFPMLSDDGSRNSLRNAEGF